MKSLVRCLAILLACCAVSAQEAPKVIEIHAKRFSFSPAEITLVKGEPATLSVTAEDTTHGLSIPDLNVNATLHKGKATTIEVNPTEAGTFHGQCNQFCGAGHGSMLFTVIVKDK